MDIAVVGGNEFTLGFALTGIKNIFDVEDNPEKTMRNVMNKEDIGIIITDDNTMEKIDEDFREDIENSVKPVAVILSTKASHEGLRKMIKKSIGVDLWKD